MAIFLLIILPVFLPLSISLLQDPAPSLTVSKKESRSLECKRLTEVSAHEQQPGLVSEPAPRGSFMDIQVVHCHEVLMQIGERPLREEAILSDLSSRVATIAETARSLESAKDKRWMVDVSYPAPGVAAKIAFATKTALLDRSLYVSDRVPVLAAGDLLVLARLDARQAYPLACQRYVAEGSLSDNDALLVVALIDARETVLHAGLCTAGEWRWLL